MLVPPDTGYGTKSYRYKDCSPNEGSNEQIIAILTVECVSDAVLVGGHGLPFHFSGKTTTLMVRATPMCSSDDIGSPFTFSLANLVYQFSYGPI